MKLSPKLQTFIPFGTGDPASGKSLADAQLCDDRAVTLDIDLDEIVQQPAALTDHLVHAQTAVVVVGMGLEVLGELADALGEDGDLDFRRTGVALVGLVRLDDGGLLVFGDHFCILPFLFIIPGDPGKGAERSRRNRDRGHKLCQCTIRSAVCKEKLSLYADRTFLTNFRFFHV